MPALPEVVTEGETEQEALANAGEAIRAILDYRRTHGLVIPSDASPEIRRVTVAVDMAGGKLPIVDGKRVVRALSRAGFITGPDCRQPSRHGLSWRFHAHGHGARPRRPPLETGHTSLDHPTGWLQC